ncbi:glycoside hydrolase family 3 protein [Nakamurella deserti]|uniref:glycoside hydrolase family 3 protein n=1 Tax=Nakamurella deserti TaxID=2164074 RepID=UPI000DBE1F8A|nr:glycoside hydrolase family 3 C-terminal domain-containing protein [Nakamurella deserti]
MNPTEPDTTALTDLVSRLDLASKVRLLTGATAFTLPPEPRIGLGELRLSDGPTGVRGLKFAGGRVVSLFPNATLLASAWDVDGAYEVGRLLAEEALVQQIHVVLGPTINLHRSLLGGRLFEAYSEDPLLTGHLAAAYVRGMQDAGVAACLKHLVANESETERNTVNSVVDEATLRELYLLPFEIAATDAHAWTMMAGYNDVNGVAATEQVHVNSGIVKGEWAWDGLLMSDWTATKTTAASANGGQDLVMPGPVGPWGDALVAAVQAGEVAETTVDDHVVRLLRLAGRVGALGDLREYPTDLPAPDSAVRRRQLRDLATAGMTVLTNEGVLPLAGSGGVAVIGRHAVETAGMGGGSAQVNAPYQVSVADGLTALLGDRVTVVDGVEVRTKAVAALPAMVTDPESGLPGVGFTLYDAAGTVLERRSSPTATTVVGFDDDFEGTVARIRLQARLTSDGPLDIGTIGVGDWRLRVDGRTSDWTLAVANPGPGAELLDPPSRATPVAVPAGTEVEAVLEVPALAPGSPALAGLIVRRSAREVDTVLAEAAAAAAAADVAVVVVGLTAEQETEAVDKSTLALPGRQDDLVRAVAAAAAKTVVVINAATPVLMPWLDEVDAVLVVGLPGQEAGHAVAAVLTGAAEPSGRLVTTWPVADGATPAWNVTPVDGAVVYDEGTFIGYRGHHAGRAPAPAFWFGHGLGYTSWDYSDVTAHGDPAVSTTVSVTVHNTGDRDGREVVQLYFAPADPAQPVRLVGWTPVTVAAGGSATVTVTGDPRMWRRWEGGPDGSWATLPSAGELLLARGLGDIRERITVG